jgi:hypothetical protein
MHLDWGSERHLVHADGDYHAAVHVWIYVESTGELLLQKRADRKDSWPGLWDISSAGHISAGDTSLITARQAPRPSPFVCVCVCVCVWVTLIRLWLHLLSFYLQFSCLWRFFWNFIDLWCCLLLLWQARTAGRAWNHITIWGFWTALCLSSTMVRHNLMCLICQQVVIVRLSVWTYFQEYH